MKRPTKKSSVKKSKSKKKSPLLKYQFGGSDSYSGFDQGLDYQGLDFNFTPTSDPTLASPQRYEGASVMPGSSSQAMPTASSPSAGDIAGSVTGAISGIGSSVMAGMQDTSVKDPSGYFNQSTKNRIERARKGQKEAGIASGIGTTISSIAPMTGPAAPFLLAIGALTTAGSEIARASYKGTEGKTIGDYDERVRQRNLQKQRRNRILQQQKMYSQPNYYDLGETGGLKKYMGGGFTKVTGPSHENGGVPMDLSGDGVIDSELEGGEIIETMKGGGKSGQKYIWSDHLKKGGKSFAKNFEEMKRKGKSQAEIEGLRVDQEIAANRDPNMLYAKYGGMMNYMKEGGVPNKYKGFSKLPESVQRKINSDLAMKYGYGGKINYMEEGGKLPKDVLKSRLESHMSDAEAQNYLDSYKGGGLWANIHAKRKRIAAGSGEKMRKPGSKGAPTAKALRESKKDGGYLEYKKGGFKSPAWTRKEGQNPSGGLNAKGRASAKAEGSNLKAPVSSGTNPRRVSFAARFAGMKGPMKNEKGEPTRKALALKKWGFGSEEAARNFANRNKKSAKYGGLMKYQTAGTYTVQPGDSLSAIAQAQGVADYNEIYNLNKGLIGSDPGMIKPGQVLTMPGATPAAPVSTGSSPLSGYAGVSPLAGYPGFGAGTLTGSGKRPAQYTTAPTATTPPPAKDSKSIRKELPYGIAAAGTLGQIATVASIDAKKGVAPINVPYIKPREKEFFTPVRDTGKAGREAERRATIREINKATGPQKFALADQARATLLREEEKAKANIDAMNTKIEQAEITLNTSRKDSIDFKNSEIALQNATSARNEALRVLESVNNKKKAYGDIFRGATKDILQYYSAEELARATEGERGVMGRFYDNPYDKFSKQYKKQNPGASPQETYAAFQTSLTV